MADLKLTTKSEALKELHPETSSWDSLLRLTGAPSDEDKQSLRDAGFTFRSLLGTIAKGTLSSAKLEELAGLSIVTKIELTRPLA